MFQLTKCLLMLKPTWLKNNSEAARVDSVGSQSQCEKYYVIQLEKLSKFALKGGDS